MNLEYPQNAEGIVYKRMRLYSTKKSTIIMGYSKYEKEYKLLYIPKSMGNDKQQSNQEWNLKNIIEEDKQRFPSIEEAELSIKRREDTQRSLNFICKFYGIVGFYKFLEGYYLLYIKEIQKIAKIGRHKLWKIQKTEVLKLFDGKNSSKEEQQFKKQLNEYDMTQGFYSSYSYDLTNTLNRNMMRNALEIIDAQTNYACKIKLDRQYSSSKPLGQYNEMFMWNYYAVSQFYQQLQNKKWVIPIIHGYLEQKICLLEKYFSTGSYLRNLKSLNSSFSITLVSRRCRHHAGTRFSKRGINEEGFAANYVETEQIVVDLESTHRRPSCSSFIQIRGSAPVFWHQDPSLFDVKPPIQINQCDPYYSATKKHFGDLFSRYGEKVFCMDLVKSTPTQTNEEKLAQVYCQVVDEINSEIESKNQITYFHFDMKKQLKTDKTEYVEKSYTFAYYVVHQVGIFQVQDSKRSKIEQCVELQNGVLRSNCVDCLDRTNSFQQLVGEIALAIQLAKMFQSSAKFSELNVHEKVLGFYRGMYERMGDIISEQYGSSKAHKQNIKEQKTKWRFELFTSIQRHFKNNISDSSRQQGIDLFLGNFIPDENQKSWQNPIKKFFPKDGYENLVFRSHQNSISSSGTVSANILEKERESNYQKIDFIVVDSMKEERSWWKRSIGYYKEETYINLIRKLMEEQYKQTPEQFEKQYLTLFKTYPLPLHNLRNRFTFKKFQIEFINIINKYDKSKLYSNSLSIKLVIILPKNTFQKISRKEISEKLNRDYNKLIHLFPEQEIQHIEKLISQQQKSEKERSKSSMIGGDLLRMNLKQNKADSNSFNEITANKKNTDQFDIIPEKQYTQIDEQKGYDNQGINFSTMNRSEKVVNYNNLAQINEMDNSAFDDNKEGSNTPNYQLKEENTPSNDLPKEEEDIIKYYEPKQPTSSIKQDQANSVFFNQSISMHTFQKMNHAKSYQSIQEVTLQERFLIDDYFSSNIKTINENTLQDQDIGKNKNKNTKGKNLQKNGEVSYGDYAITANNLDEYFNYNKLNQKSKNDQAENYFDYKDIGLKQQVAIEINSYFDYNQPNKSVVNLNQKYRCQKCYQEQLRGGQDDHKNMSSFDYQKGRGLTTFLNRNELESGEKSSKIQDTFCKHHHFTEFYGYNSSYFNLNQQTQYQGASPSQFKIVDQGLSRIESEIGQSNVSSEQTNNKKIINEGEGQKKNVQLLDMLVKRNFIFPSNTIINIV